MIRTRMSFKVYGSTDLEIRRRAVSQINEFLDLDDDDFSTSSYEMEINVEELENSNKTTYVGNVLVKIKY